MMGVPEECPNCGRILYRVAHLRPAPSFSWPARGLVAVGALVAILICWGILTAVPTSERIRFRWLGMLLVLVGVITVLPFALFAYRLPKVLNIHCSRCGWRERVIMDRRAAPPGVESSEDSDEPFAD